MKVRPTVFRMARAAITAAVIFAVASCCVADAQTPATASDAAVKPSALPAVQAPGLPHGAGEVLKMYQAGIDKNIIIRYIESTSLPYHLSADGIIYLQSLGVPQDITKAMIVRDGQLQQQQPVNSQYFPQQPMQGAVPPGYPPYGGMGQQPPTQIVTPTTPAPAVDYGAAVDYGDYTDYGAGYPYYGYPYYGYAGWPYYGYYGWPGWGWGWGWGGRGWGWGWGGRGWGYGGYRGGYGGFRGGVGGIRGGGGFRAGVGGFHGGAAGGFHGGGGGGGFHGGAMGGGAHGGGGGHR